MKNFEKNDFVFSDENVRVASIVTSSTQAAELVQCYHGSDEGLTLSLPFVSIEIIANTGDRYTSILMIKKFRANSTKEEQRISMEQLYEAYEAGFKLKHDDYRLIRKLHISL